MTIKIEDVKAPSPTDKRTDVEFHEYLSALRDMKSGQSFVMPKDSSHYRLAISISKTLLECDFMTRKEPDGRRRIYKL